jgi:hypothetical protein
MMERLLRIAVLLLAGLTLLLPASAFAHVTVTPTRVDAGERLLTFVVPNELFEAGRASRITTVAIEAPRGVRVGQVQAKGGWTSTIRGRTATWTGGSINFGHYDTFGLLVEVPRGPGLIFRALERFKSPRGHVERYPVPLSVDVAAVSAPGSRGLAIASLIVAVGASALALGAFFMGLRYWLLRS